MQSPFRLFLKSRLLQLFVVIGTLQAIKAQDSAIKPFNKLSITDGLPQSFISGMAQDSVGFVWIGTRDGLARYDGKKFKLFMHKQGDTATLSNNIIESLFLDSRDHLWILYETGEIDILNTRTEHLFHLSKDPVLGIITGMIKPGKSIAEDKSGNFWLITTNGGVFVYNPRKTSLRFFSEQKLGLSPNSITGIFSHEGSIGLVTDKALFFINDNQEITQTLPYTFNNPHLYDSTRPWKDTYTITTKNGSILIRDLHRLILYDNQAKQFKEILPPSKYKEEDYHITKDEQGQVIVIFPKYIYTLSNDYKLIPWRMLSRENNSSAISLFVDRSGILWLGGNGSGIQLINLRSSGLTGISYTKSYHEDLLKKYLHVPDANIRKSFLDGMYPYYFRSLKSSDGKIWISKSTRETTEKLSLLYYKGAQLVSPPWHYSVGFENPRVEINALAESASGKLWGMDFFLHPVLFNTVSWEVTIYPAITKISHQYNTTSVSSLLINGEDNFWIGTAFDGLFYYNHTRKQLKHFTAADLPGSLPSNQLMSMLQDPDSSNILWIGSLGGGLIRFNKQTEKCQTFTINDGLPNNTIYAVLADQQGNLWCSTNKGIFSFGRKNYAVRSFSSSDGLPCDEFNRYHYFQFPDGRISFGGIEGFTVFSPDQITNDSFQPNVALTGISINNKAKDFGFGESPFSAAINSLQEIKLPYDQNFLSFEMAALQYNNTQRQQYRYMLEGFDKQWVYAGTNSNATYTNIPPGNYQLKINATNTAGTWSNHVKNLKIEIQPPFWKTNWFIIIAIVLLTGLIYLAVLLRIKYVRKEEQQFANFEKQATTLKEQAMRAQMNPHFIFNCLNSIKSLIQEDRKKEAIVYLTTFSRLIRNQLNNAQELISLHSELETCKLYTQLEALRFGEAISCNFEVNSNIDLFSVQVPPLILQPFIENAIWHGILPNNGGCVTVTISQQSNQINCVIDDDGIGRKRSLKSKSKEMPSHESKGMQLVQNRLNLYNAVSRYGSSIDVIDKTDEEGNATGTQVILTFKQEQ